MLIVVGGMIGLGKTTIAEYIAEKFNAKIYYESVDDNPILPYYYKETPEEINRKRYPFLLQLYFLNSRFEMLKDAALNATKSVSVIDRSIYEDWYFAKINYDLGRMSELEISIYEKLLHNMMQEIDGLPKKAPTLMVYLKGSFENVIDRIKKRGRAFELGEELISYYRLLWQGYDEWLAKYYHESELIVIDTDKYDIVYNIKDRETVLNLIEEKLLKIKN